MKGENKFNMKQKRQQKHASELGKKNQPELSRKRETDFSWNFTLWN